MTQKEIRKVFRVGNRLLGKAVNAVTNPLGDINNHIRSLHMWTERQSPLVSDYFERTFGAEANAAAWKYNRPVVRGRDGHLYSHSDMDDAMMNRYCA